MSGKVIMALITKVAFLRYDTGYFDTQVAIFRRHMLLPFLG